MLGRRGTRTIGVLDLGTSKIVCLICSISKSAGGGAGDLAVAGVGHQRSRGMKAGVIADPADVEAAIRSAVGQAERESGIILSEVYVAITCGRLASLSFAAHADIGPAGVTASDIGRTIDGARAYAERDGRFLVHMNRHRFRLDGVPVGDDPRGMAAQRLSADMHAVTADETAIRNVLTVVERCHLTVAGLVAAPYASALAVTTPDERRVGVTVIDLGGGTSGYAVFSEGDIAGCGVLATGGHHLTFEIAQNLHTQLAEAERIKTLYASMVNARSDVCDRFSYRSAGESDGEHEGTRAQVSAVVRGRMESVMGSLAGLAGEVDGGQGPIVLTGGGSQLMGIAEAATRQLGRPVRLGRPRGVAQLGALDDHPAFAAAIGLALVAGNGTAQPSTGDGAAPPGYLRRVGRWFAGGFSPA
jgi:cell division protein FtsA